MRFGTKMAQICHKGWRKPALVITIISINYLKQVLLIVLQIFVLSPYLQQLILEPSFQPYNSQIFSLFLLLALKFL